MKTLEEVNLVKEQISQMSEFQYPAVNGIGITKTIDGELAILVMFVGGKPENPLPEEILGVKVIYQFNVGVIKAYVC